MFNHNHSYSNLLSGKSMVNLTIIKYWNIITWLTKIVNICSFHSKSVRIHYLRLWLVLWITKVHHNNIHNVIKTINLIFSSMNYLAFKEIIKHEHFNPLNISLLKCFTIYSMCAKYFMIVNSIMHNNNTLFHYHYFQILTLIFVQDKLQ